jgi:hypothetical protein
MKSLFIKCYLFLDHASAFEIKDVLGKTRKEKVVSSQKLHLVLQPSNILAGLNTHGTRE